MSAPSWAKALLRFLAPRHRAADAVGDLEEMHRDRVERRGRLLGTLLTCVEALDMALALLRSRLRRSGTPVESEGPELQPAGGYRLGFSWLDIKLGLRMLVRYPGLTVVGGLAMAFAICVGAAVLELTTQFVYPKLPLDEGDRIVAVRSWNTSGNSADPLSLYDFASWKEELSAVADLGGFRRLQRNLITGEGRGEPIRVAEISASAFRVARVPPLMGRTLIDADEQPQAPPVVVIGHGLWQTRFGGEGEVLGRTVRLGSTEHTIVGVMPEGFAFPVADEIWVPLRLNVLDYERGNAPRLGVFGRLNSGVSLEEAQSELTTLGLRVAADYPETNEHVRPQVVRYTQLAFDLSGLVSTGLMSTSSFFGLVLLVLICGNVALLMFARAATRESEIAVRHALGASRRRIIGQLFTEALVLGTFAAAAGLGTAGLGLRWALTMIEANFLDGEPLPFWFTGHLSLSTVLYAVVLTVVGAFVAGALPALKVTGRGADPRLRQTGVGGGGLRFGRVWSIVMIVQVAVTVLFTATAAAVRWGQDFTRARTVDFPGEEYLSVRLEMDRQTTPGVDPESSVDFLARYGSTVRSLEERLSTTPEVAGVTLAERMPRMYHPWRQIEVAEGAGPPPDERGHRMASASIDVDYFDVFGKEVLSGRSFHSGDVGSESLVVIVNQSFVTNVLAGRNAIGRHIRYLATEEYRDPEQDPGPWHEIVGVVGDLGTNSGYGAAGIYHPMPYELDYPVYLAVHLRSDPATFAARLRSIGIDVDPTLRLHDAVPLSDINRGEIMFYEFWSRLMTMISGIALLLALAGIYSVMSFAVSRRRREIGIRVALGSGRGRIAVSILKRPVAEVALGVIAGSGVIAALAVFGSGEVTVSARGTAVVTAYALLMMAVCMLACIVPTRRALGVEPTEALRADG